MIGIIILNYKTPDDVVKCCDSIKETTTQDIEYKIYIVDNNSDDGSYEQLSKIYGQKSNCKVIGSKENKGYSTGNNIGIKEALKDNCSEILLTNPDVLFKKDAIKNLLIGLYSQENIAVAGPLIFNPDGTIYKYCKKGIKLDYYLACRIPGMYFDFKQKKHKLHIDYDVTKPYIFDGMVSGCCFMIKSNVVQEIGLWDENVFLYYEEDILWSKLNKKCYLTIIQTDAEIIHNHSVSIGSTLSPFSRLYEELSALYYLRKYRKIKGIKYVWAKFVSKVHFLAMNIKKGYRLEKYKELKAGIKKIDKLEIKEEYNEK